MNTIYTVSTVSDNAYTRSKWSRTWGWYSSKELAEEEFRKCPDLLLESGTYQYILIEEVPMGIGGIWDSSNRWWYSATYLGETEESIDTYTIEAMSEVPECYKNVVAFSMG